MAGVEYKDKNGNENEDIKMMKKINTNMTFNKM